MKVSREEPSETPTAYFSQLLLSGTGITKRYGQQSTVMK